MANNKEHQANYTVQTVFGKCLCGFKSTSGFINPLVTKLKSYIQTPLHLHSSDNLLVNEIISTLGIKQNLTDRHVNFLRDRGFYNWIEESEAAA